jgi:hypothetical protein
VEEIAMAKRRMRRTGRDKAADPQSTTHALTEQARDMSVGAAKIATEAARAALGGMQALTRSVADMAAPAARRAVKTASDVARAAAQSARQVSQPTRPTGGKRRSGRRRAA